jgi:hypothetical protein
MREQLTPLQTRLFEFARTADQLNTELRNAVPPQPLTEADRTLISANQQLQPYLSQIARKAECLASALGVAEREKEGTAA